MTYNIMTRPYQLENNRTGNAQKKSGRPTQPGNRSTASRAPKGRRKQQAIIYKIMQNVKRVNWRRLSVLCLAMVGAIHLFSLAFGNDKRTDTAAKISNYAVVEVATKTPEYIFRDGEGTPVNMQAMTNAWATEAGYEKRYDLTDAERWEVASVVTAEAGGEPFAGMVAVAQCILQSSEDDGIRPDEAVEKYKYTKNRPEPTEEALEAVQAVFDFGHVATTEPIKYFYSPNRVQSKWHETQEFVVEINGHRFFAEVTP